MAITWLRLGSLFVWAALFGQAARRSRSTAAWRGGRRAWIVFKAGSASILGGHNRGFCRAPGLASMGRGVWSVSRKGVPLWALTRWMEAGFPKRTCDKHMPAQFGRDVRQAREGQAARWRTRAVH